MNEALRDGLKSKGYSDKEIDEGQQFFSEIGLKLGKALVTAGAMTGAGAYTLIHNMVSKNRTFAWDDTFRWCKKNVWGVIPSAKEEEYVKKRDRLVLLKSIIDMVGSANFLPALYEKYGVADSDFEKKMIGEEIVRAFLSKWQCEFDEICVWMRKQDKSVNK